MRLNLERLDATGLTLDLSSDLEQERRVVLGSAAGLRGALAQDQERLRLSELAAESLVVSLLQLKFEALTIASQSEGTLGGLAGNFEQRAGGIHLELAARTLRAPQLTIELQQLQLRGDLVAENVLLHVSDVDGRIQADVLEVHGLKLLAGSVTLVVKQLIAKSVDVSWSADGYSVKVGEIQVSAATVEAEISGPPRASETQASPSPRSESSDTLVDWDVLDGLTGTLDVDLFVDMSVPVIGSRRATHHFRIPIQSGSLNYLDLEGDLSILENTLLDFAVRQGALVLERGIPLLPTRGRGKPIIIWDLNASDYALVTRNRVRLAVLPQARLAEAESAGKSESKGSGLALRGLSFGNVDTSLRLEVNTASTTVLRGLAFEELALQGNVYHRASGEPPKGELTGQLRGLQGSIVGLSLGTSRLDLGSLKLGQLSNLRVQFRDVHPQKVTLELEGLHCTSLAVGELDE